jgi:hypothetical protein
MICWLTRGRTVQAEYSRSLNQQLKSTMMNNEGHIPLGTSFLQKSGFVHAVDYSDGLSRFARSSWKTNIIWTALKH